MGTEQSSRVRVVAPEEGHALPFLDGSVMSFLARSDDTSGLVSFWEFTMPSGAKGPPPHVHHGHDELFYIVTGDLVVHTAEGDVPAPPRSLVVVPRGAQHTFSNVGPEPMRMVGTFSPGSFEGYFDELAAELAKHDTERPDPSVIAGLYARYDSALV